MNDTIPLAVDCQDIALSFRGGVQAVDGVDLHIAQGEIVAILGPNGAGKTTLIDCALGLATPDRGTSQLLGMSSREAIRRGLIGVVNQSGALPVDYSVERALRLFRSFYLDAAEVDEILERTNLTGLRRRKIARLSGGEQQRLRLALALLPRPLLVFLDEPTTGMDPTARIEFWKVMNAARDEGLTMVFATHYLAEAESHAERTIIMRAGKIVADAPTHELLRRSEAHLSATLPPSAHDRVSQELSRHGWSFSWSADTIEVRGQEMEDAARIVLAEPGCRNLRIADSSLEDVFSEITTGETATITTTTTTTTGENIAPAHQGDFA